MTMTEKPFENWLRTPSLSPLGTIWLAGELADRTTIPRDRMRILGRRALVLVLAGKAFYADDEGLEATLRPGDALLLGPQRRHAYGSADGAPWGQAFVVFDGPAFVSLETSEVFRAELPHWHLEPVDLWRQRLEGVFRPPPPETPLHALRTVGRFLHLLTEMAAIDAEGRRAPEEAWLEESLQLLGEPHRAGWLSPQTVARTVGLSYESFRKRFAAHTGLAPGQYQQQRRIDLACAAIFRGDDNFKELAGTLGFCDVYHFSKAFRRHVGEPPSVYRRRVRGG